MANEGLWQNQICHQGSQGVTGKHSPDIQSVYILSWGSQDGIYTKIKMPKSIQDQITITSTNCT